MSKIGAKPISVPSGVQVEIKGTVVNVKGPKGALSQETHGRVNIELKDNQLQIGRAGDENKQNKAYHGLYWSLINNMIIGTSTGFTKNLVLNGTGYRAKLSGKKLELSLGFSHPVEVEVPEGIECSMDGQTKILIGGIDKQQVGQFSANVRKIRPPEPYKGKGVRYENEHVRRKAGKSGK